MTELAPDADLLRGKRVAFTGRLASMTRKEAADLVASYGGTFVPTVSHRTNILVVGQEGWPLRKDGRLTSNLQKAQSLQARTNSIVILTEEELLGRLGLESQSDGIRRLCTTAELTRILNVSRDCIRAWTQAGFIRPALSHHGVCYFEFRHVSGAKTLSDLVQAGVTRERLQRSLRQLRRWMPDVEQPLAQLSLSGKNGELFVRLDNGQLAMPSGQLVFDFDEAENEAVERVLAPGPATADEWLEIACQHEEAGEHSEAVHAYRRALLVGGIDANTIFELANALYALGRKEEATERYYQAVELKPGFVEAWNNLGTALAELGRFEESAAALRKTLELDPHYMDAHYNLADVLEEMGRAAEAYRHWQAYVQQDPHSDWGRYARERLRAHRPSASSAEGYPNQRLR
jgi:tetratricopeptide (TPR) repeat protein